MSDPISIYADLTITIPAGSHNNGQVIAAIEDDMWYSWLAGQTAGSAPLYTPWIVASVGSVSGGTSPVVLFSGAMSTPVTALNTFKLQPTPLSGTLTIPLGFLFLRTLVVAINSTDAVNDVVITGLNLTLFQNPSASGRPIYTADWEGVPPEIFHFTGACSDYVATLKITDSLPGADAGSMDILCSAGTSTTGFPVRVIPTDPRPVLLTAYWTGPPNTFDFIVAGEPTESVGTAFMEFWDIAGNPIGSPTVSNNAFPGPGVILNFIPQAAVYWALATFTGEPVDGVGNVVPAGDSTLHVDFFVSYANLLLHQFYGNVFIDSLVFSTNNFARRSGSRAMLIGA